MYTQRKRNIDLIVDFEVQLDDILRLIPPSNDCPICVRYRGSDFDIRFEATDEETLYMNTKRILDATVNSIYFSEGKLHISCSNGVDFTSAYPVRLNV